MWKCEITSGLRCANEFISLKLSKNIVYSEEISQLSLRLIIKDFNRDIVLIFSIAIYLYREQHLVYTKQNTIKS